VRKNGLRGFAFGRLRMRVSSQVSCAIGGSAEAGAGGVWPRALCQFEGLDKDTHRGHGNPTLPPCPSVRVEGRS
jgi:hypothetical protein